MSFSGSSAGTFACGLCSPDLAPPLPSVPSPASIAEVQRSASVTGNGPLRDLLDGYARLQDHCHALMALNGALVCHGSSLHHQAACHRDSTSSPDSTQHPGPVGRTDVASTVVVGPADGTQALEVIRLQDELRDALVRAGRVDELETRLASAIQDGDDIAAWFHGELKAARNRVTELERE